MAELDYALLADFAKVEAHGALTVVGGSWTHLEARTLPASHRMSVAGRVRARIDEETIPLRVDFEGPDAVFRLAVETQLTRTSGARPYGDGLIGHLFALDLQVPLPKAGLYTVHITVSDERARRLAFDVATASPTP